MSKGYASEDAADRLQRAREAKARDADEEAAAQRALAAAGARSEPKPPTSKKDARGGERGGRT